MAANHHPEFPGDGESIGSLPDRVRLVTPVGVRIVLSGQPTEFRRGDLLFANRLSSVQALMNLSADPWTHCAVVGQVDGELRTVEVGPRGCFSRSIADFVKAYRYVGLGRLDMTERCIASVAAEAERSLADQDVLYSWPACFLTGIAGLTRRLSPTSASASIIRSALGLADRMSRQHDPRSLTCSGFVVRCIEAACGGCRPELQWPCRERIAPWRAAVTVTDLRGSSTSGSRCRAEAVRLLAMPSDLWVSVPFEFRSVTRPDMTTVLFDLTDSSTSWLERVSIERPLDHVKGGAP
jgi:hypothetical protein